MKELFTLSQQNNLCLRSALLLCKLDGKDKENIMKLRLSHEFIDESLAEKVRWFAKLTIEERIAWLDEWTEIVLQNNPQTMENFHDDNSFKGTVCVLEKK